MSDHLVEEKLHKNIGQQLGSSEVDRLSGVMENPIRSTPFFNWLTQ